MLSVPRYHECFVCGKNNRSGLNVTFYTEGQDVTATVVFAETTIGYPQRVHGGIMAGLLDEAMGWACTVQTGWFFYTVQLEMRYLKPAAPGVTFQLHAQMQSFQKKLAKATGVLLVKDNPEHILARAEGQFYRVSDADQTEIISLWRDCHEPHTWLNFQRP